jgi:hypothetical protein
MNRDPADLARIAPEALELINALDALYSLLEACEEESARWLDPPTEPVLRRVLEAQKHARACWDELTRRDSPQEIAALKRIKRFKDLPDEPATIRHKWTP